MNIKITCHLVNTEQLSGKQRAFAIKPFYKNNDSYVSVQRSFRVYFNLLRHDPVP